MSHRIEGEQARVILSKVHAAVPKGYGFYLILCPQEFDAEKVVALGNLSPELIIQLLPAMAESMQLDPPERILTS